MRAHLPMPTPLPPPCSSCCCNNSVATSNKPTSCFTRRASPSTTTTPKKDVTPLSSSAMATDGQEQRLLFAETLQGKRKEPFTRTTFYRYCQSTYCEESMNFWGDVEMLKQATGDTSAVTPESELLIVTKAETQNKWTDALVHTYVNEGADKQINISDGQRRRVLHEYADFNSATAQGGNDGSSINAPKLFDEAQHEVVELMYHDPWKRFLQHSRTQNLSEGEAKYRWIMGFIMLATNIVVITIMFIYHAPRWYAFLSFFPWFGTLDYMYAGHKKLCPSKAMYGLRVRDDIGNSLRDIVQLRLAMFTAETDNTCQVKDSDPTVLREIQERARKQIQKITLGALFLSCVCFALTYVVEAISHQAMMPN